LAHRETAKKNENPLPLLAAFKTPPQQP